MALRKEGRNRTCKMKEERGHQEWKGSRRMGGKRRMRIKKTKSRLKMP